MRLSPTIVLVGLLFAISTTLLVQWIGPDGRLLLPRWTPPVSQNVPYVVQKTPAWESAPIGAALVVLERPLFSLERRPPSAVPTGDSVVAPPPPDVLDNVQISGIFVTGDGGGLIARIEGKTRRVRTGESVGDWTLAAVEGREARFERSGDTRTISLKKAAVAPAGNDASVVNSPGEPTGNASTGQGIASAEDTRRAMADEARDRLRRRNEVRARAGLPPVTD